MRFRWAQARRFPLTFLRFHSLSEDLEESCLIGDLNHLNKTSWHWADTTQEVPGDEECAARIYFPFFMAVSQSITTTLFFFPFLVQPSLPGTNHRKNRTPPPKGWTAVAWHFPMNWLYLPPWWDETNISESRGAMCEVLFSKVSLSVCAYPCKFHLEIKVFIAAKLLECISANYFQLHNINRKKMKSSNFESGSKICMGRGEVCVYRSNGFQEASNRRRFPSCLPFTAVVTALEPASETKLRFEVIFLPTGKIRGNPTASAHTQYTHSRTKTWWLSSN